VIETPAAFARRLGVHKSTVCRAIKSGRLIVSSGMLDVADSLQRWENTKPGTRPDVLARHAAKRSAGIPAQPGADQAPQIAAQRAAQTDSEPTANAASCLSGTHDETATAGVDERLTDESPVAARDAGDGPTIAYYRKVELIASINAAKLAIALRSGQRFARSDVEKHATAIGSTLRAALERLVDTTAARLTLAPTKDAKAALIRAETAGIRRLINRQFVRSLRTLRETSSK